MGPDVEVRSGGDRGVWKCRVLPFKLFKYFVDSKAAPAVRDSAGQRLVGIYYSLESLTCSLLEAEVANMKKQPLRLRRKIIRL